jgi:hypothetical protein
MKKIIWLGIFSIAMAFVEATVVYYLRKLYYPGNIIFPINISIIPSGILAVEWVREACTIIMLLTVAILAGKKFQDKFAYFIYCFAIWDIFYYIWLRVILGWPMSVLAWDILFLIPVTWISPVLAPVLVSVTMIILAATILKYPQHKINFREWLLLILSAILLYVSFVWDYSFLLLKKGFLVKFSELTISPALLNSISGYTPTTYHWDIFILAEILAVSAIFSFVKRVGKNK